MKWFGRQRGRIYLAAAFAVLAIYAALSVGQARSAADRLDEARDGLAEVTAKLRELQRLRDSPKVAALRLESPAEITGRIARAGEVAGLPQSALLKVGPQEPRRLQRSDFKVRATEIDLAAHDLPTIIAFCDALRDESTGTRVRDLTLTAPGTDAAGANRELWEAQLVLTQIIYSPTSR